MQRTNQPKLSSQVKRHTEKAIEAEADDRQFVSTGSTLLDLAVSGGCHPGGGLASGNLVEVFSPPSCGKTVLLCEIAGAVQRQGGEVMFYDPEARLNKWFARLFGLNIEAMTYSCPDTVPAVFAPIRKWEPESKDKVHGVFADSLAALSTDMEMGDGDKYGMRRAKEFSEQLRLTCRTIRARNLLMVCSNQVRENVGADQYAPKFRTPGGQGIPFYASLRLHCHNPRKIKKVKMLPNGKEVERIVGVDTVVEVHKSSMWKPWHQATVRIVYDYGIDDIAMNLAYVKDYHKASAYAVRDQKLSTSLEHACRKVEDMELVDRLRAEVIELWEKTERLFEAERRPKR